jgi:N-acetylmuramoyl-L-alanine amidase
VSFTRLLVAVIFLTALFAVGRGLLGAPAPSENVSAQLEPPPPEERRFSLFPFFNGATPVPRPSDPTPPSEPTRVRPLPIGIVAGHWGSDSGAICDDGALQEVDVNLDIARRVVDSLRTLGYEVDLLEEYDERLEGYEARALISIHADSCLYPEASGFKVARVADSAVPELEDHLVACLIQRYQARTGLAFHEGSITPDMLYYHNFYEIDSQTPGAIIETGFLLADRELLLEQPDVVARGILQGIVCFVEGEIP